MVYTGGDDPQLLNDLRTVLKRWHRSTLGAAALTDGLTDVQHRIAANPWLTRAKALRQAVRAALALLRDTGRGEEASLLERRYLRGESLVLLADTYGLSERSIYNRLREAHLALAHALWALEQREAGAGPDALPVAELSATISAARHLPPPSHTRLFGIDQVLAQLLAYLEARDRHWLISLDGMAGLGKTALAREAAGRLAAGDRFAGIAWVTTSPGTFTTRDPQPMGLPALTCSQVLDAIARQLAGIGMGPLDLEAKHEHVRDLLRARSYLVVLDNLETAIDCRTLPNWFWDMANPSKFLLTSRHWLVPGAGASVIFLAQLSDAESLALIRHEAHLRGLAEVVSADDEVLRPILDVTGGNPLAIKLVVGQLLNLPLSHILTTLRTAQADTDPLYRFLYRVSWNLVSEPAQHLLLAMVRLPASGGNWDDLSAISGLSGNDLSSAIGEVTSHSLVQVSGFEEKTYCLHPLTYHFAHSKAAARKP